MSADEDSTVDSAMTTCPYCAERIKAAAVKCRYCQSNLMEPTIESAQAPRSTADADEGPTNTRKRAQGPASRRQKFQKGLDSVLLFLGVGALGAIAVVFCIYIVLVISSANDGPGETCSELEDWYADNPGDSNRSIAKDYYRACDELPPPVISGELDVDDIF